MKVIFLDFDGIINNFYTMDKLSEYNVRCLKAIIMRTGAKCIATSSNKYSFQLYGNKYEDTNYYNRYIVPLLSKGIIIDDYTSLIDCNREKEIEAYLDSHSNITQFLILDDDYIIDRFKEHEIFIDHYQGISSYHIKPAIDILNGKLSFYPKGFNINETVIERNVRINNYYHEYSTIYNILTSDDVVKSINENLSKLLQIIPEIKSMIGFDHKHPHHHLDVWNHTLLALSMAPNDFDVRLSLLLHDIGKPHSYTEGDVRHFKGHADVSAKMAKNILKRLHFDNLYVSKICYLIANHDTPITEDDVEKDYDLTYTRYEIQVCDALAHHPDKLAKRKEYLFSIEKLLNKVKVKSRK